MLKKLVLCLAFVLALHALVQACDMSAVILGGDRLWSDFGPALADNQFSDFDVPADYPVFVMSRSNSAMHDDGYGILYYEKNETKLQRRNYWYKYVHSAAEANQVWYTGSLFNEGAAPDLFDYALQAIRTPENRTGIVMCHARNASSNPFAPGNHPFRLDLNNRTYSLMHNGFISQSVRTFMINEVYNQDNGWFTFHRPNYDNFVNAAFPACWIDSEVLFHYLMCHIAGEKYDVVNGLRTALKKLESYMRLSTEVVNFVFSDGERLFTFRSTPVTGINCSYKLSYRTDETGFSAVRTGVPIASETELCQYELVILDNKGRALRHPDFLADPEFTSYKDTDGHTHHPTRSFPTSPQLSHPGISISFQLEEAANIVISIYSSKGQLVRCINNSTMPKGNHTVRWNGLDKLGKPAARGVYYLEMKNNARRTVSKIVYSR